jgi:hypothetical protein
VPQKPLFLHLKKQLDRFSSQMESSSMINATAHEIDYDSLAEDQEAIDDHAHNQVVELKLNQIRQSLQKGNAAHQALKQRDLNRMSSSQELLNKARIVGWQGATKWKQNDPHSYIKSTLLIPNINKIF